MVGTAVVVLVGCLAAWFVTRQTLPRKIRIATGEETGLYHDFGKALALPLESRSERTVELRTTAGSLSNSQLLDRGEVELALLQAGFLDPQKFRIVAPLYAEPLHVIVRKGRGIENTADLAGRNVALGPKGSGMRTGAQRFLRHYAIDSDGLKKNERYLVHPSLARARLGKAKVKSPRTSAPARQKGPPLPPSPSHRPQETRGEGRCDGEGGRGSRTQLSWEYITTYAIGG